ncbi:protein DBF4 homolog B [Xenopus laevis]|uniref:Protein DBF4 homolog B n=1 Tax=Xenopus laevis TaxID=8355 RepID=DBF4B_XENLA|nr:protein DBF4 homolog B [Xenopus laevis]Q283Q6.1 RecName: Full=Protein DBF4 homolog B; AltName: Full=Dbf4-related factor 1; AltName: Full=XDrf1 [Xenopus laevis]ABB16337.1 Drf1 [Xenopus laevis]
MASVISVLHGQVMQQDDEPPLAKRRRCREITFAGKSFYLDVPANRQTQLLTKAIGRLGGIIESFLSRDVDYVVTGSKKAVASVSSVATRRGEKSQIQAAERKEPIHCSRGKQLLKKVVHSQECNSVLTNARSWGVTVLYVEDVVSYIERLERPPSRGIQNKTAEGRAADSTRPSLKIARLRSPFIKIEDQSRKFRPLQCTFTSFPELSFVCSDKSPFETVQTVKKKDPGDQEEEEGQRSQKPQARKRKGYCECCEETFDTLSEHLVGEHHFRFVSNPLSYKMIDDLAAQLTCDLMELPFGSPTSPEAERSSQNEDWDLDLAPGEAEPAGNEGHELGILKATRLDKDGHADCEDQGAPAYLRDGGAEEPDQRCGEIPLANIEVDVYNVCSFDQPVVTCTMELPDVSAEGKIHSNLLGSTVGDERVLQRTNGTCEPHIDLALGNGRELKHAELQKDPLTKDSQPELLSTAHEQLPTSAPCMLLEGASVVHFPSHGGTVGSQGDVTSHSAANKPHTENCPVDSTGDRHAQPAGSDALAMSCVIPTLDNGGRHVDATMQSHWEVPLGCTTDTLLSYSTTVTVGELGPEAHNPTPEQQPLLISTCSSITTVCCTDTEFKSCTVSVHSTSHSPPNQNVKSNQTPSLLEMDLANPNCHRAKRKHWDSLLSPPGKKPTSPSHCQSLTLPMWLLCQFPNYGQQVQLPVWADLCKWDGTAAAEEGTVDCSSSSTLPKLHQDSFSSESDWDAHLPSFFQNNPQQSLQCGDLRTAQVTLNESWYGKQLCNILTHDP